MAISNILSPLFAVAGIAVLAVIAAVFGKVIPFYRKELRIEDVTRLTPLDGLRGILCFAVMYHHAAITYFWTTSHVWDDPPSPFYLLLGKLGVGFFFCVTAFLFWSHALRQQGNIAVLPFLRGRLFRIAPLYCFSLTFALLISAKYIHWLSLSTLFHVIKLYATLGTLTWFDVGSFAIGEVNARVIWTLRCEWAFYFALPALALMAAKDGGKRIFLLFLTISLLFLPSDADYFAGGIIAAHVYRNGNLIKMLQSPIASAVAILALLSLGLSHHLSDNHLMRIGTVTVVFTIIACGNSFFGLLNLSGLRLMGVVSYSVYLLHGIVLYMSRPLLARYVGAGHTPLEYWTVVFVLSIVALIVSLLTFRWVEFPFIQIEKRLRKAPGTDEVVKDRLRQLSTKNTWPFSLPGVRSLLKYYGA